MNAEQLLYAAGAIRDDFIREADPARPVQKRRLRRWAAYLAACLAVLAAVGLLPPDSAAGPDDPALGCSPFPGAVQDPQLYWQGRAYTWFSVKDVPQDLENWIELGPLAGATAEETAEDLWLHADIGAVSGTVYAAAAENPEVLYARMMTEWFEEERWVRFVGDSRLVTPVVFYDGQLYDFKAGSFPPDNAILTLPAKYEAVGTTFLTDDPDALPSEELEVNFSDYANCTVYAHPRDRDTIYVEVVHHSKAGSRTVYAPAARFPQISD